MRPTDLDRMPMQSPRVKREAGSKCGGRIARTLRRQVARGKIDSRSLEGQAH